MMTENDLRKVCPRCGGAYDLAATVCGRCGRKFRTPFPSPDVTLKMPLARPERLPAGLNPSPPAIRGAAQGARLRFARPTPTAPPADVPPEVRHRVAVDEYSRRFLGLAPFYVLAVLSLPTVLIPALALPALRAVEARLCAEVAALGLDAGAWAAPLRRDRSARIVRGAVTALALAVLFVAFVFVLHKGINALDSKMDPLVPESDGAGAPSSH